ncbi:hypothetical protein Scep_009686 [Stephania cephalantha]|uniref:Uncharacterized protein n=1 Tax=Stephania cephalantha TaxID=152367 RepID=A0AAP0PGE6_9MAGN
MTTTTIPMLAQLKIPPPQSQRTQTSNLPNSMPISTNFLSHLTKRSAHQQLLHQSRAQFFKLGAINDPRLPIFISSKDHMTWWSSLIKDLSNSPKPELCVLLYIALMFHEPALSIVTNPYVIASVLKACSRVLGLSEGTQFHGFAIKSNAIENLYVVNAVIRLYAKCGELIDARCLFDKMPERSVVSWNVIIMGYAESGEWEEVKSLFWLMVEECCFKPDAITLVRMVTACTRTEDCDSGKRVHEYIDENGVVLSLHLRNALMNMYVKFKEMGKACQLFNLMSERDVVSWTTLVSGYAGLGHLEIAIKLFDQMPNRNVVAWNALITGYVSNGCFREAVLLFRDMLALGEKPDKATIVNVLPACMELEDRRLCETIHGYACKGTVVTAIDLSNSLIGMYSKFGRMDSADLLFSKMPLKNEVSWTLMMVGYLQCGEKEIAIEFFNKIPCKDTASWNALMTGLSQCNYFNEALRIFHDMLNAEITPNGLTLVTVLSSCARIGALELGIWIHAYIERNHVRLTGHLASSLIDMYAKCGRVDLSLKVFDTTFVKDLLTWSSMISGFAMHGHSLQALEIFNKMLKNGVKPDGITFLAALSACSHAGLVNEGRYYFNLMTRIYDISPTVEHNSCMVDLFGRCGLLQEAKDFINNNRTSNETSAWGALLNACRLHGDIELAEYAAIEITKLDPVSSGAHVLLSNTYATASRWSKVGKVRNAMKEMGIGKLPGCSSIEVNGIVHEFFAFDASHPQHEEIHSVLHVLLRQMNLQEHYIQLNYFQ